MDFQGHLLAQADNARALRPNDFRGEKMEYSY